MGKINDEAVVASVRRAFDAYEAAIAGNDIAALNGLFWKSPSTLRYGYTENLYGHEAIAAFRSARPAQQTRKEINNTVVTTYGDDFATVNIDFMRGTRNGRQSQTWVRFVEGWRIVAAHVSFLQEPGQ
jgi:hypothetical protein